MYAALPSALARADPSSRTLVVIGRYLRAGSAAQGTVPLRVKRVDPDVIKCEELPDLTLVPDEYGIQLQQILIAFLDLDRKSVV